MRCLLSFADGALTTRNRQGIRRDWLRGDSFETGLRSLPERLPILWLGTVLDGERTAGRFQWTMAAVLGSKRYRPNLRFVVFDVPIWPASICADCPGTTAIAWSFCPGHSPSRMSCRPSSPPPPVALALDMAEGRLEGIVLKDRHGTYRDGSRRGWSKVKDPSWIEREGWRFDRR